MLKHQCWAVQKRRLRNHRAFNRLVCNPTDNVTVTSPPLAEVLFLAARCTIWLNFTGSFLRGGVLYLLTSSGRDCSYVCSERTKVMLFLKPCKECTFFCRRIHWVLLWKWAESVALSVPLRLFSPCLSSVNKNPVTVLISSARDKMGKIGINVLF